MVINKSDLQDFAKFLRDRFQATPMLRTGDDGELLRAVVGHHLLIVLDLNRDTADVWCSDASFTTEVWAAWRGLRLVCPD